MTASIHSSIISETMTGKLSAMRNYFNSGATRPYSFRKRQLLALKNALIKYENEIANALYADLKKSPEESYGTEVGLILADISLAIKKLHLWMRPQKVSTNLVNLPSSSFIYRDPLGVALIIAPWNYPIQLLMMP